MLIYFEFKKYKKKGLLTVTFLKVSLFNLYRNTVYIFSNYTLYQRNSNLQFHAQISIKILYLDI